MEIIEIETKNQALAQCEVVSNALYTQNRNLKKRE